MKKPNTSRSSALYASLSKYRLFRPNSNSASPSTPPARPISLPYALASKPPYRPDSSSDFLERLATYKLTTYRDKPSEINAVAASKAGWVNDGKERLVCNFCSASWAVAATAGMNREAAATLIEKQRSSLVANHKDFCPWKRAQCDGTATRRSHASDARLTITFSRQIRYIASPCKDRPASLRSSRPEPMHSPHSLTASR